MDDQDMYANVEEPSGAHINWNKRICNENIYTGEDTCHAVELNRIGPALSGLGGSIKAKNSSCRAAAVILGLLCLLLLTGLITLVFLYTSGSSKWEMEMLQLQTSYKNLTEQKDQLETSYKNLTEQKDQLETSYKNLTEQKALLETSYRNLTKQKDQLETSYKNLSEQKDQLETSYKNLTELKGQLETSYKNLTEQKDQLETSYKNLTEQKDQLETSYKNLSEQKDQLETSYKNLTELKGQLETTYKNLSEQKDQLETSYKNLAGERDQLQKRLEDMTNLQRKLKALQGWRCLNGRYYYISSVEKSWKESRDDCLQKGADLVIINNREEQEFTRSFNKHIWLGLTRRGTWWKWVDETPLTTSFWAKSEPNNAGGNENCAETKNCDEEKCWNDVPCDYKKFWMCETTLP